MALTARDLFYEAHKEFKYKPETGILSFRDGTKCVAKPSGHIEVSLTGVGTFSKRPYTAQRVIWLMRFGQLPEGRIFHLNEDKLDNRLENLKLTRKGAASVVAADLEKAKPRVPGVRPVEGTPFWKATIGKGGKVEPIGIFENYPMAVYARFYAEREANWLGTATPSPAEIFVMNSGMLDNYL